MKQILKSLISFANSELDVEFQYVHMWLFSSIATYYQVDMDVFHRRIYLESAFCHFLNV